MRHIPLALKLWSVRDNKRRDFASTVAAVGQKGYRWVELARYGNPDANAAKAALNVALGFAGITPPESVPVSFAQLPAWGRA